MNVIDSQMGVVLPVQLLKVLPASIGTISVRAVPGPDDRVDSKSSGRL
jgi:hypothetical protein